MNVYDQLTQLQVIEQAFVEWKDYRAALTQYIINELPVGSKLAILGAGRCNDLDLKALAKHCSCIVLLDRDEQGMKEAVKQYGLSESDKVKVQVSDFVGITSDHYRAYADALVTEIRKEGLKTNVSKLAEVALCELQKIEIACQGQVLDLSRSCYDYSVVIGVHSQLITMLDWIWQVMLQTLGQEEVKVRQKIIEMNNHVVEKLNTILWQVTRYKTIIGCEKSRVNQIGSIEGAIQALNHIEAGLLKGVIKRSSVAELEWPFNKAQGISYKMQLQVIESLKK